MNAINRCGQRVVCIQDHAVWANFCCDAITRWPIYDQIYTVTGFSEIEGNPGIFLRELPRVNCACVGLSNAPWPLVIFRAIDERRTDISEFTKLLDQTPQPIMV